MALRHREGQFGGSSFCSSQNIPAYFPLAALRATALLSRFPPPGVACLTHGSLDERPTLSFFPVCTDRKTFFYKTHFLCVLLNFPIYSTSVYISKVVFGYSIINISSVSFTVENLLSICISAINIYVLYFLPGLLTGPALLHKITTDAGLSLNKFVFSENLQTFLYNSRLIATINPNYSLF